MLSLLLPVAALSVGGEMPLSQSGNKIKYSTFF